MSAGVPVAASSRYGAQPISAIAPEITAMTSSRSSGSQCLRVTATSAAISVSVNAA